MKSMSQVFRVALFIVGSVWKHCKHPFIEGLDGGIFRLAEYSSDKKDEPHTQGEMTVTLQCCTNKAKYRGINSM